MPEHPHMPFIDQGARDKLAQLEMVIMRHVDVCTVERMHLKEQRQADNEWKKRIEDNFEEMKDSLTAIRESIPQAVREALKGLAPEKQVSRQITSVLDKRIMQGSIALNGILGAGVVWLFGRVLGWW